MCGIFPQRCAVNIPMNRIGFLDKDMVIMHSVDLRKMGEGRGPCIQSYKDFCTHAIIARKRNEAPMGKMIKMSRPSSCDFSFPPRKKINHPSQPSAITRKVNITRLRIICLLF